MKSAWCSTQAATKCNNFSQHSLYPLFHAQELAWNTEIRISERPRRRTSWVSAPLCGLSSSADWTEQRPTISQNLHVWRIFCWCQWSRMRRNGCVHIRCHIRGLFGSDPWGRVHHLSGSGSAKINTEYASVNQPEAIFRLFIFRDRLLLH